jgi:hypothetical protein
MKATEKKRREKQQPVPAQKKGTRLDVDHTVEAGTPEEAQRIFTSAAHRLLDINRWDKISGPLSSTFRLTDSQGGEVNRLAQPGDYFKINIPAPGSFSGEGYDWVRIEALIDRRNPSAAAESITLRVRPAANPQNADADTAHFFKDDATSSFMVERIGDRVIASVHGRNEEPNTDANRVIDKVRNALIALGAIAGFARPQWKALVKGLLD